MYHFRKLDTLRFFAFFLVFWQHGFADSFKGISKSNVFNSLITYLTYTGGMGVNIFFVISGFIITFLLIKEHDSSGKTNIIHFYLRRILRIWPLYYLVLISGIFMLPHVFHTFTFNGSILKNLCFLNNFDTKSIEDNPNIGIAWSVAIEEQFYLFWPLFFVIFYKIKLLPHFCLSLIVLSSIFTLTHPISAYYHTFGNINYLMTGCLGALIFTKYQKTYHIKFFFNKVPAYFIIMLILIVRSLESFKCPCNYFWLLYLLLYLWLVMTVVKNENNYSNNIFSRLGKYTYGMYLYHPIILIFVKIAFDLFNLDYNSSIINFILAILSLALTIEISILSYNYIEKPFLNLKGKISTVKTRV